MKPLTEEWLRKAQADFDLAALIVRDAGVGNSDAACFHAQQAAEKFLKAVMQELGIGIPRTHDLPTLARLIVPPLPALPPLMSDLQALSALAVDVRYPGFSSVPADAQQAMRIAENV